MTTLYNEIDPFAGRWLRELCDAGAITNGRIDGHSIEDLLPSEVANHNRVHLFAGIGVWDYALREGGWDAEENVWTCSCPCQPFSAAGKGGGFTDERHLWPAAFHLISECCPLTVFGEQVASKDGYAWLDLVQDDLEGLGYTFGAVVTPAAGYGAPHGRHRIYWVAKRRSTVADRDGTRCGTGRTGEAGAGRGSARVEPSGLRASGELVNPIGNGSGSGGLGEVAGEAEGVQREARKRKRVRFDIGSADGSSLPLDQLLEQGRITPEGIAALGVIADAHEWVARNGGLQRGGEHGLQPQGDDPLVVGDSHDAGREGRGVRGSGRGGKLVTGSSVSVGELVYSKSGREVSVQQQGQRCSVVEPSATNGFWKRVEWLACTDGYSRPTEPGLFPLAHGSAARLGLLRGYGNALCAPQAVEFVRSYLEVRTAGVPQTTEG